MLVLSLADWQNGNNNQDDTDANYSWNCGQEGDEAISPPPLAVRQSGTHIGCTALRITLRFCSRYREFPTT